MDIQKINIQKLKPAKYNPRIDLQPGDKEYQKIKKSIETFGYVEPIIVNKDQTIIGDMNLVCMVGKMEKHITMLITENNLQ